METYSLDGPNTMKNKNNGQIVPGTFTLSGNVHISI